MYREAGAADTLAKLVLAPLWKWIAKLGLTKDDVLDFFRQLFAKFSKQKTALKSVPDISIPDAVIATIAKFIAQSGLEFGDFAEAVANQLENPPPGYRWKVVDTLGTRKLLQVGITQDLPEAPMKVPGGDKKRNISPALDILLPERPPIQPYVQKPIARGNKFEDAVLITVWWATSDPSNNADRALRAYIQSSDGDIFWEAINTPPYETEDQFGGFVVVPRMEAQRAASHLCKLARDAAAAGNDPGEINTHFKLAAIHLYGFVENRPIADADKINLGCINSIKFNWFWTLPDILMGNVQEFNRYKNKAYDKLIFELDQYANRRSG